MSSHVMIYVEDDTTRPYPDLLCVHCGAKLERGPEISGEEWMGLLKAFSATHATCKRTEVLHFPDWFDPENYQPQEPTP